jgi:hypothetical protein
VQRRQPQQPLPLDGRVQAQPAMPVVEPVGVVGERPSGCVADVARDHAQGQGQVAATVRDPARGARVGADRNPRHGPDQQRLRLGRFEHVDGPARIGQRDDRFPGMATEIIGERRAASKIVQTSTPPGACAGNSCGPR